MTAPLSVNVPAQAETDIKCDDCSCSSKCCLLWCGRKPKHHHHKPAASIKPTEAFKKEFARK